MTTRTEFDLILKVAERAEKVPGFANYKRMTMVMDLESAHKYGDLDLARLLDGPDQDFNHDISGIHNHIERDSSKPGYRKFRDCFVPRFTV